MFACLCVQTIRYLSSVLPEGRAKAGVAGKFASLHKFLLKLEEIDFPKARVDWKKEQNGLDIGKN